MENGAFLGMPLAVVAAFILLLLGLALLAHQLVRLGAPPLPRPHRPPAPALPRDGARAAAPDAG